MADSDSDSDGEGTMRCVSCREEYDVAEAGTCKECYDEASETEQDLKREIEDLKSKVSFLALFSPSLPGFMASPRFLSDVVLVAASDEGASVPAHKAVLASRSPVFKAMLENEMEESRSDTIKIHDVSYEALRVFVNFLYTAEARLDQKIACALLELAEKYEVKYLKAHCEKYLVSQLNWDNSLLGYAFAHQQNAKLMQDAALSFITDNMDKVTKREEYQELVKNDPRIVVEIYEAYLGKQVNTAAHKDSASK